MEHETSNPEDENAVTVIDSKKKQSAEVISREDEILIDETINLIREIYTHGVMDTIMKIGTLIFEKIYGNDVESFDTHKTTKKGDLNKSQVFQQLAKKSEELAERGESLPRKTWLYNAVRLVVENKQLSDSPNYGSLSISHRVELLKIENRNQKLEVVKEIESQKLSVRETRQYISSLSSKKRTEKSILFYIKYPQEIKDEENFFGKNNKAIGNENKKLSVITKCEDRIRKIEAQISDGQKDIMKLKNLIKKMKDMTTPDKKSKKEKETKDSA